MTDQAEPVEVVDLDDGDGSVLLGCMLLFVAFFVGLAVGVWL